MPTGRASKFFVKNASLLFAKNIASQKANDAVFARKFLGAGFDSTTLRNLMNGLTNVCPINSPSTDVVELDDKNVTKINEVIHSPHGNDPQWDQEVQKFKSIFLFSMLEFD